MPSSVGVDEQEMKIYAGAYFCVNSVYWKFGPNTQEIVLKRNIMRMIYLNFAVS